MIDTFVNPRVNPDANLGVSAFDDAAPVRLWSHPSEAEVDIVIRAAYRQVLGNAHVMESERLIVAESKLKQGELSVREFVRRLAKSELYRSRFFDSCYRYRAIELNYKHLLGRAPDRFEEMRYHSTVLDQSGFEADIDTYLDSDEYQAAFGEDTVPYYRGYRTQPGQSVLEFTNLFRLLRSASSSDGAAASGNKPQLTRSLIQSASYGQPQSRDANEILAELFQSKPPVTAQSQIWTTSPNYTTELTLRQTIQEQAQMIDRLQQQLKDLRPFATIGAAQVKNDWQPVGISVSEEIPTSLQQQAESQKAQIVNLQEQISDARRYAAIGEARLNKWRSRTFNS